MTDLLGPASAANSTTARPADARIFGGTDTFFKDCTSPAANDGTVVEQAYLNAMLMQIRRAIRGMSVAENNANDDMLLNAIQSAAVGYVPFGNLYAYMILWPYAGLGGGLSLSAGSVVVNASGNTFCLWRGATGISAASLTAGQRTFAVGANTTYHLRWHRVNGLQLRWLGDGAYNPGGLVESHQALDSTYDDALLARITTNGSSVPTATVLANTMACLATTQLPGVTSVTNSGANLATGQWAVTYNWGRTPQAYGALMQRVDRNTGTGDNDENCQIASINRYGASGPTLQDGMTAGVVQFHAVAP
jgi:hypothetical protein